MISSISAHHVANAIRMKRTVSKQAFAIVEGGSDKRVLACLLNENTCKIEIAHGKENLLDAMQILLQSDVAGILGIADADFARLLGVPPPTNVFLTDYHDLECMLLKSPATKKVLAEFGSEDKLERYAGSVDKLLASVVYQASKVGCLRLLSLREGLNLKFNGMKFSRFTSEDSLVIDERNLVEHVLNLSNNHGLNVDDLKARLVREEQEPYDRWQLACGPVVMT